MDVIATAQTGNTAEKRKRKNQKVKERTRKKTLTNQTNQKTPEEKLRMKVESYYRDNNVKMTFGEEDECLTPEEKRKRRIESYYRDNNVKMTFGEEDECMTPEEKQRRRIVSYYRDNNVKMAFGEEGKCLTPEEKQRRRIESYYRDNNVKVIFREEAKCCIAGSVSAIKDIGPHVESLLQDSPVVGEATDEIVKEKNRSEGKQKQKTKLTSRTKNEDEVPITDRQDEHLATTTNGKCGTEVASVSAIKDIGPHVEPLLQDSPGVDEATTEIFEGKKSSEGKQKHETKWTPGTKNKIEVPFIDQQDELLVTTTNEKCGTKATSVSANEDIGPHVEPLLQDSPVVDEATTEIVKGKTSSEGKQRQITKLTSRTKNKVEVPIIDQQDKLLVTTTSTKCGTKTEIGKLHHVDTRSKFHVDNVSCLASSGMDDLPNYFDERPQRELTTCSRKILVVLDINGLLADIVVPPPKDQKSDINIFRRAIFKRPYCDDFLNFCFDTFDVGIWSSRTKRILVPVVDYLLGERKHKLLFCWDRSHTTISNFKTLDNKCKPLVCKDLSNLWAKRDPALPWEKGYYTESNTLLIDDSPYKALLNPMHTAIFPNSFSYNDQHDNSIGPGGELRVYLQNLAKTGDVRKFVEEHPFGQCPITEKSSSWDFYSKVINSLSKYI